MKKINQKWISYLKRPPYHSILLIICQLFNLNLWIYYKIVHLKIPLITSILKRTKIVSRQYKYHETEMKTYHFIAQHVLFGEIPVFPKNFQSLQSVVNYYERLLDTLHTQYNCTKKRKVDELFQLSIIRNNDRN